MRRRGGAVAWAVVAALLAAPVPAPPDDGTSLRAAEPQQVVLVAEPTPAGLTVAVSRRRFPTAAAGAVLIRDDVVVDGLAGSGLLSSMPLLATPTRGLADAVAAELRRVTRPGAPVYLLGGETALSGRVAEQVRALGRQPVRLAGPDRAGTAAALADVVGRWGSRTVVLVRGWTRPGLDATSGWVDAIAVGAWAADTSSPVLLVGDRVPVETTRSLRRLRPARVVVVGGEAAVPASVLAQVAHVVGETGGRVVRVAGPTRGATAVTVARTLWGRAPADGAAVVIRGDAPRGWVAGLAGAGLGADRDAPVVLAGARTLLGGAGCLPRVVGLGVGGELTRAGLDAALDSACGRVQDAAAGTYAYEHRLPDGTPLRYDHCHPLRVVANFTDAPANAPRALRAALDELRVAGIAVAPLGTTTRRARDPFDREVGGLVEPDGSYRPIVVSWPPAHTWDATGYVGYGGSSLVGVGDATRYVTGSVQMRPTWRPETARFTQLLQHELGHVIGLDHVDDTRQLMNPVIGSSSPLTWGPGDRAGLAGLLDAPC